MGNCDEVPHQTPNFCFQGGPIRPCFGAAKPKNGVWNRGGYYCPCLERIRDLLKLTGKRFCPSKTHIFVHLGRETAQERLRNGWRNGRVSAKVTASASLRGDERSWGVALPSDQASRRSSPARARVPPGPFSPTLYLNCESSIIGGSMYSEGTFFTFFS